MALVVDIADAVVTVLNAGSFSSGFTAQRKYVPRFDLKEMVDLHVTVVPRSLVSENASRTLVKDDIEIDVAVQKKLSGDLVAEGDALMQLAEEMAAHLRATPLAGLENVVLVKVANDPIYAPEHWDELRQFTSVLTLAYRTMR